MSKILRRYKRAIGSAIIISAGMFMHLNRISIIELRYSNLPMLVPNAASSLFVFSLLCIFSKLRPLLPRSLQRRQKFLTFLVETCLIFYATDLLLRQVWLPCIKLLSFCCHFMGQYVAVANRNFLKFNAPLLSHWLRNDAFYIARFLLAAVVFFFMLDVVSVMELIKNTVDSSNPVNVATIGDEDDNPNGATARSFDANELPYDPPEDLLTIVPSGRKGQTNQKLNRRLFLNDNNCNEYSC